MKRVNTFCFQEFRHSDWLTIQKSPLWHEDMFRLDDYLFINVRLCSYIMEQYYGISYDFRNNCKKFKFQDGTGFWIHGYAKNVIFYSQFNYSVRAQCLSKTAHYDKNASSLLLLGDLCPACGMKPCLNYKLK